ncbi:hypothetical protein F0562_033790 [Nyssa sinensis]|uniref:Uncharacterized protein n=1 Tax=Nyssa sinensis TaxID=561372 RepID=A0A5J5AJW8_9ASTE|nr:hypothetical protein F0562_033790 [Nyssa sinensis]
MMIVVNLWFYLRTQTCFPKGKWSTLQLPPSGSFYGQICTGENVEYATASTGQEIGFPNELSIMRSIGLQLSAQYPYPSYNFSFLGDKKFQPEPQLNLQGNTDFSFGGHFEPPSQSGYCTNHHNWASTSAPYYVAPFDEHLFSQQYCSSNDRVAKDLNIWM